MIKNKLQRLLGVVLGLGLVVSMASQLSPTAAFAVAGSGHQFRNGTAGNFVYINAWGGGPLIKVFDGSAANNDFTLRPNNLGFINLVLTNGGGAHAGQCISDSDGTTTDAKAGLTNCTQSNVGWGANFTEDFTCGPGAVAFHNEHWNGWLAPKFDNRAKGTQFYLNSQTQWCWAQIAPF